MSDSTNKLSVLIVEDELIIAEDLRGILESLEYEVCGIALSAREAMVLLEEHAPDLALLNIEIKGGKDGIELAAQIREQYKLPYIFLTSYADRATLQRAKEVYPYGYLVKPFLEQDIHAAIEVALNNFARENESTEPTSGKDLALQDSLFVKNGGVLVKVRYQDITYLEADANYTNIFTSGKKKFVVRSILKELEQKLNQYNFTRIHKSYLINLDAIDAIDTHTVHVGDQAIPISRSQHNWLLSRISTL